MLLKKLTEVHGVSGNEDAVRKLIIEEIKDYADEIKIDVLGNVIAMKNIHQKGPKLMLSAHMDEIGLMVVGIEKNGLLKFRTVGGIDERILVSKQVEIGAKNVPGVIGAKAIHLQKSQERTIPIPVDQLYIDIGAQTQEEAEKAVMIGDYVSFASEYQEMGTNYVKGKAFDDRVGCAVLIEMLKKSHAIPLYAVFTVQEEIGLRGATVAAHSVDPEIALIIEGTTASDVVGTEKHHYVTQLGKGPALSVMDRGMIANHHFNRYVTEIAEESGIPVQIREGASGGNDAGRIHLHKAGVLTGVLSIPVRYIHSPHSMIHLQDYEHLLRLTDIFIEQLSNGRGIGNETDN